MTHRGRLENVRQHPPRGRPTHGDMLTATLFAVGLAAGHSLLLAAPAQAQEGRVTVSGVGEEDMLKLRAGPGTGFRVLIGLPEGAELISRGCQRVGGTPWCEVRLVGVRGLSGYVSGHYLSED